MKKATDSIGNPKILISLFDHSGRWSQPYKDAGWDGLVLPGERICLVCGRKRGIKFF